MSVITFFNSSLTQLTANIGWNSQESRLNISLVDDNKLDNYFSPVEIGFPCSITVGVLSFCGLLERWTRDDSFSGLPVYSVDLCDPRVLFDGVNLILGDYFGPTYTNNTFNIFGFYENTDGFGTSQRNESGIPWRNIVDAITRMQDTNSLYGKKMSYKGISYTLDLSGLPQLPDYYRVAGTPSISLMQFVSDICETANCDFIVDLQQSLLGNVIRIITISRNTPFIRGQISRYIASTDGVVSRSFGEEMVNETCSKMLIGGKKTGVYLVAKGKGVDDDINALADNPLEQYWGSYENGNIVVPTGLNKSFTLDSKHVIVPGVGDTYNTSIAEIQASLDNQSSWESYLWIMCMYKYFPDKEGSDTDFVYEIVDNDLEESTVEYKHSGERNPHFRKAFDLKLNSSIDENISKFLMGATFDEIIAMNAAKYQKLTFRNFQNPDRDVSERLYDYVKSYADTYYGKQFMVMVPEVNVSQDSETGTMYYSHLPSATGYVEERYFADAIQNGILPVETFALQADDGRLHTYVRFNNVSPTFDNPDLVEPPERPSEQCDFSGISNSDILYGIDFRTSAGGTASGTVFIKCNIKDKYVYINGTTFYSPRAVVELPARVTKYTEDDTRSNIIAEYLAIVADDHLLSPTNKKQIIDHFIQNTLTTYLTLSQPNEALTPDLAGVTLESQTETYGPWYANIADGRCEIELAEDLVPWNYTDFTKMNQAGLARVSEIIGTMQFSEAGTIEVPGLPTINLGLQLIAGGPYITDISVTMGTDGMKTTYQMKGWTPRFGKLSRYDQDRIARMDRFRSQVNKNMREHVRAKLGNNVRKIVGQ